MTRKETRQGGARRLRYGSTIIDYELIFARRKTLGIQVFPDSRVVVRAPLGADEAAVVEMLRQRAAWIIQHQRRFAEAPPVQPPLPRRPVGGAVYRFLGEPLRLKVIPSAVERVTLEGETLTAAVPDPEDDARVGDLLDQWFRRQAEQVFVERLTVIQPRAAALGIPAPERLTVRDMKTRWGSCSARRRVTLNLRLIHVAPHLIDYVIAHELCHLKVLNHSAAFYALQARLMPDWRERRAELNRAPLG
ncbi:MAG: M48 family metallopeptidase [Anaerolineae bacterium]|nr:M48 family metallopeptidase [Anaerolineae bacterium]NUQ06741.1 M48 family metallopeptidase [Anaerolineae bacterium]